MLRELFQKFATKVSIAMGSSWAFIAAVVSVLLWLISGPFSGYSDSWMLWINTGTTIITFLMVFLIQNAQNRDTRALHVKIDALIVELKDVSSKYAGAQKKSVEELENLDQELHNKVQDQD